MPGGPVFAEVEAMGASRNDSPNGMRIVASLAVLAVSCGGTVPAAKPTFSLHGSVTGVTSAGVLITVTGTATRLTTTDANGHYRVDGLTEGDYLLTPSSGDLTFVPPNRPFSFSDQFLGHA